MILRRPAAPFPMAAFALSAGTWLLSCGAFAQAQDPVAVASRYFEARRVPNCDEVWRLFSASTQANIRSAANRRERDRAGLPRPVIPEQERCMGVGEGVPRAGTARLVRQQADEAVVAIDVVTRPSRYRYDLFPAEKIVTREVKLVRESGAWRVELPPVEGVSRGPAWRPQEFGPVDVMVPEQFHPGLVDRLEATAVLRVSRDALEPAIRDPQRWALALPGIKAVQPAERVGEHERILLRFGDPDRVLPARVRVHGKQANPADADSSVTWVAEETAASPVHFRGEWRLKPHPDGSTRVTLLLHLDVRQWPGDSAGRIFSAERLARAVLDLEKAVR